MDGLEQKYGEQVAFKRINAIEGDGPEIMKQYHIPGHPTLLLFDTQGQEQTRLIGQQTEETIEAGIKEIIKENSE